MSDIFSNIETGLQQFIYRYLEELSVQYGHEAAPSLLTERVLGVLEPFLGSPSGVSFSSSLDTIEADYNNKLKNLNDPKDEEAMQLRLECEDVLSAIQTLRYHEVIDKVKLK